MGVPQVYRKADERAIASFDFVDIASGLGFVTFLGIESEDDSAKDYHLITEALYSSSAGTRINTATTTTFDFDTTTFNLPRTTKGTAYFSAGLGDAEGGGSAQLTAQIFHVTNSTETAITSKISGKVYNAPGGSGSDSTMVFLPLPITEKNFKKGEFIRLRVELITTGTSGSTLGHDPKNQDASLIVPGTKNTTVMTLLMPFKVDL